MGAKTYEELAAANPIARDQILKDAREAQKTFAAMFPVIENGFNFPEDAAHENGNYQCTCFKCGQLFIAHKRRVRCKKCS